MNYLGEESHRENITFIDNENGSISAISEAYGHDILWDIDGVWFEGDAEWHDIDELV